MIAGPRAADTERTAGLRACEHGLCRSPGVRRVEVVRAGWVVPESRVLCEEHARVALEEAGVPAPRTTARPYDKPVPKRPLRQEVLGALTDRPQSVSAIGGALTRPETPYNVRRVLDQLVAEGLAAEGPRSLFARVAPGSVPVQPEAPMSKPPSVRAQVLAALQERPWQTAHDLRAVVKSGARGSISSVLTTLAKSGEIARVGAPSGQRGAGTGARYALAGTPLPNDTTTHESMVAPVASPAGTVPDLDAGPLEGGAQPSEANGAGGGDATPLEETGDGSAPGAPEAAPPPGLALAWAQIVESLGMSGHPPEEIARVVEVRERDILALTRQLMDVRDVLFDAEVDYQGHNAIGVRKLVEERDRLRAELAEAQAENARIDNRGSDLLAEFRGALRRALDIPAGDWSSEELVTMVDAFRTEVVEELDRAGIAPGATLDRLTAAMDEIVRHRAAQLDSATAFADRLNRDAGEKLADLLERYRVPAGGSDLERVERVLKERLEAELRGWLHPSAPALATVAGRLVGLSETEAQVEIGGRRVLAPIDEAQGRALRGCLFDGVEIQIRASRP